MENNIYLYEDFKSNELTNAIHYLKIDKIKEILEKISREEIINIKIIYSDKMKLNLLEFIINTFQCFSFQEMDDNNNFIPSLNTVTWWSLRGLIKPRNATQTLSNELTVILMDDVSPLTMKMFHSKCFDEMFLCSKFSIKNV